MGFFSRLRAARRPDARAAAGRAAGLAAGSDPDVQQARVRARRRLIGAALLLGAGVIAFPLIFETQPRPVPVDVALDIPDAHKAPPLTLPASAHKPALQAPSAAPPAPEPRAEPQPAPVPAPKVEPAQPPNVEAKPVPKVEAKPEPKAQPAPPPKAEPTPAPRPAAAADTPDAASDSGRFVVQVGAFAEDASARTARRKVEAMGLKTYTQEVQTAGGKRIRVRVGPYASREQAQKAADRIKAGGLPAAVLTL